MNNGSMLKKLKLGFTWCYLLRCTDGYLMIDTSYPGCFPRFQRVIAKLGVKTSDIKYLFLTHHHDDHAGFAARLVEETGCRVIAHSNAIAPLRQGASEDSMQPSTRRVKILFSLFQLFHRRFDFPPLITKKDDVIIAGDDFEFLKSIGIDGKILCTPGHSRDSISIVLSDGTAFVGDAAMNFLKFTGVGHRPIYAEEISSVHASWQTLIDQGARVIYPSHGPPFPARELVS